MKNNNLKNIVMNSAYGMFSYVFVMISTMITRMAFARYLGRELLGLNTLFTSILQILQITELGIGNAIIVFLYEPVKLLDKEKTKALISLYKKVYNGFTIALLSIGLIVQMFILPKIVDTSIDIRMVQNYFFLFLFGVVCSYVCAYSKSIFYAEQKVRIVSVANAVQKTVVSCLQLIVIFVFENYYAFLLLFIAGNLLENILCHRIVMKSHPYLKEPVAERLSKEEKTKIINLVKSIFVVRMSDKILGQSDSIIINRMIDIVTLGMYGNYHTIFNAVLGLFSPIGAALTSSYGNLSVSASAEEKYDAYKKSYPFMHYVVLLFSCYFLAFIQDFIYLTYGLSYKLDNSTAFVLTIYLYVSLVVTIYYSYQNALGLHKLDQKQIIAQVPLNIISSVILAKYMGLNGVIWGTILSLIVFSFGFKGRYLYQYVFNQKISIYYTKIIKNSLLSILIFVFIMKLNNVYVIDSFIAFFIKAVVLMAITTFLATSMMMLDVDFRNYIIKMIKQLKNKKVSG